MPASEGRQQRRCVHKAAIQSASSNQPGRQTDLFRCSTKPNTNVMTVTHRRHGRLHCTATNPPTMGFRHPAAGAGPPTGSMATKEYCREVWGTTITTVIITYNPVQCPSAIQQMELSITTKVKWSASGLAKGAWAKWGSTVGQVSGMDLGRATPHNGAWECCVGCVQEQGLFMAWHHWEQVPTGAINPGL